MHTFRYSSVQNRRQASECNEVPGREGLLTGTVGVAVILMLLAGTAYSAGLDKSGSVPMATTPTVTRGAAAPAATSPAAAALLAGEQIKWQVIASGGTKASSTNYRLGGTVGQTAVGAGASTNYRLGHGFWQPFGGGGAGCCQQRGDVNDDGVGPDISDLVALVGYMFGGEPYPGCMDPPDYKAESDIDGNGVGPDIADLVALVSYMFGGCPSCLVPCQ